ncbi:MAG: hypothetical protein WAV21_03305 [Minisyncoccia bacterium]
MTQTTPFLVYTFRMVLVSRIFAISLIVFFCLGTPAFAASIADMDMMHGASGTETLCPLMGMVPACASMVDHMSHWQSTFAPTLAEFLSLLTLVFVSAHLLSRLFIRAALRVSSRPRQVSDKPTLFQRLCSQGILNPKIP